MQQIALSERSQQVTHQHDYKHRTKPYSCASAHAPPVVAEVSSAPAENEQQNNNENDHHLASPCSGHPRVLAFVGLRRDSLAWQFTNECVD
ncbi:hypothetical protein SBA5_880027 [Candidatus Sulfotelmatomonas gaucii]|uniref:Uncharacterized protein n=1 Tax=Candidatus Sulfuritelmatomonas gaucii TaxID=2043161 RepID=A0A2N9M7B0_9BACT|nr:hypothetical protein SBA5_880027 [Candidatus Sulfotelmatomonas gaucii]